MKLSIILLGIWSGIWLSLSLVHGQSQTDKAPYIVSVKSISVEQGLPNQQTITIGQDQQGFIWIGTLGNAYRFDGHQFSPMPAVAAPKKEQQYNPGFTTIGSDRLGNFWLTGSVVGPYRQQLVIRRGQTRPQPLDKAFAQPTHFQHDIVIEYATASDNMFQYFRTRSGVIWRQTKQGTFLPLFRYPKQCRATSESLYETAQHTLLVTLLYKTDGELIEIDSTGRILHRRTLPGRLAQLKPIWKAPDGTIYFARLLSFDSALNSKISESDAVLYQLPPDGPLTSVRFETSNSANESRAGISVQYDPHRGVFWVLGIHSLQAWHPQQGIVFDLARDSPMIGMHNFKTQFIDHTGAIWVATTTGLWLINLEPNRFRRYLHVPANQPDPERYSIRGMTQVGDQLWVNSTQCWLVDQKTGQKQLTLSPTVIDQTYTTALCPVVRDQDGILWSALETLLRVDPTTFRASTYLLQPANLCVSIWPDGQHRLWLGFHHGLAIFDTKHAQLQPFTRYNQFGELAKSIINGFFPDKQAGLVWVAASSGLYLLDTLRGITARYSPQDAGSFLPSEHITFVHPDPDEAGVYWLATRGDGLIRWNRNRKTYQHFTQKQGLSDNTLYAIYADKHGRLWLPSNHGLMSFHRKTHQIRIFHTNDGIADEEFNLVAHYRAPDGRLFLGGLNGITAFYPDQIRTAKSVLASLLVTKFQKLDTETGRLVDHYADFKEENDIHLTASDRLFTLGFTLLDYRHLGQTRLWYRIKGWQEKWVVLDRLELSINGLPAGDYTIEVRAQALNGDWASPISSIPIGVDKPFYLQVWFLLVIGGGILAAFRWRNQQLVRDKTRLEAEVARRTARIEADKAIIEQQAADLQANATLKSRFFANVSHEFRTPLTLLMGPLQYLSQRITDSSARQLLGAMERNTQQLLSLVNDLLNLSRLDIRQLELTEQPADLAQLVYQTTVAFMSQAQYAGVQLEVMGCNKSCSMLLDTQKTETVLRNLLANALHYTSVGGRIQVSLKQPGSQVQLEVSDTGSGIHPDDLPHIFDRYFQSNQPDKPLRGGMGIGLALCREYCQLWGGELTVSSQLGKGSIFTASYPIRTVNAASAARPALPATTTAAVYTGLLPALTLSSETPLSTTPATEITILVVDDNEDMLLYIQTVLSPYYLLRIARNGREALDLLRSLTPKQLPDLIISDIMMPQVDGLTLAGELRESDLLRELPIVLLTARADLESRLQALQLGVADYMTKPFYEAELLARIHNLLRRAEEQATWQQHEETDLIADKDATDWIHTIQCIIRKNLTNELFNVVLLAELANISKRQLNRRTKLYTGLSPNQLIQEVRLQVAYDIFVSQPDTLVKAVAYQVGYQKPSHFIQLYRERFGINPGEQQRLAKIKLEEVIS